MGINPIYFTLSEESDPFLELYIGIQRLGDRINRKTLDWKQRIQEFSSCAPPTDEETISEIEQILQDEPLVRLFIQNISGTSWLEWMNERKYLEPMFRLCDLTKIQQMLANWIANNILQCSDKIIHIAISYYSSINPYFWHVMCREIGNSGERLDKITLCKLVLLLINTVPQNSDDYSLHSIAQLCYERKEYNLLSHVFLCMTDCDVEYKTMRYFLSDKDYTEALLKVRADKWVLDNTWEKLRSHIAHEYRLLLSTLVQRLEEFDSVYRSWNQKSYSPDYFFINAVQ